MQVFLNTRAAFFVSLFLLCMIFGVQSVYAQEAGGDYEARVKEQLRLEAERKASENAARDAEKKKELEGQIESQEKKIAELESEIKVYEKQLEAVGSEKKTLSSSIAQIETSKKRAQAAIKLTQEKIKVAEKRIGDLGTQITRKGQSINLNSAAATLSLRTLAHNEDATFLESFLQTGSLGEVWNANEQLIDVQESIGNYVEKLIEEKRAIQQLKDANEQEKSNLSQQHRTHAEKKRGLELVEEEKKDLLKKTKSKESEYQAILRLKREAKEEFENQLRDYESQLKYVLDQASIPKSGSGALGWPVANVRITQKFGHTAFAKAGAYNGKGHNGVDFGVPSGTAIYSAADGMIEGSGNTDVHRGCYSYGKWVLVRHNNGLSTLYGHLSSISVSVGDSVRRGDTIGYSGNTGYSTGPHLHFTVFASDAVRVVRMADIGSTSGCKNASIPVAPTGGYLNPLDYVQ